MNPNVDLVYFDAGGGHRAAAQALNDMLRRQRRPWNVRLINLMSVLDRRQRFRRLTGLAPEDLYNRRLAQGRTTGMGFELRLLQTLIRIGHGALVRRLEQHWRGSEPDLVVSLIPNFNRAMGAALARARPGVPFATVITDLADLPPRFWIEPAVGQHVIAGTRRAVQQALDAGVPAQRVLPVSGMLLRPSFYEPLPADRAAERRSCGLDPDRATAVVMYGGQGSPEMLQVAQALPDLQLVLMTGHNQALAERLRALGGAAPRAVVGFTDAVPRWLHLADFFIGKPGPGAMSEALHLGLPVLTFDHSRTMPQERWNTRWVREHGLGLVLGSVAELPQAVQTLVARLPEFRQRVRRLENRAAFEVPALLAELLHAGAAQRAGMAEGEAVPEWPARLAWTEAAR